MKGGLSPYAGWPDAGLQVGDGYAFGAVLGRTDRRQPNLRDPLSSRLDGGPENVVWTDSTSSFAPGMPPASPTRRSRSGGLAVPIGRHRGGDILRRPHELPTPRSGVQWRMTAGSNRTPLAASRRRCWPPSSSPPCRADDFDSAKKQGRRVRRSPLQRSPRLSRRCPRRPSRLCATVRHSLSRSSVGNRQTNSRYRSVRDGAPHRPGAVPVA